MKEHESIKREQERAQRAKERLAAIRALAAENGIGDAAAALGGDGAGSSHPEGHKKKAEKIGTILSPHVLRG